MRQPEYVPHGPLFRILIPTEPRRYAGQRWVKMIARAAHVVLAGVYLGALVFQVEPATRGPWFLAALLSGFLMVGLDLYESGAFLLQLRGLVTSVKLLLLAFLPTFGAAAVWVLAAIAFCSVISSHATANFRYFLVWGRGRIKAAETRG
ncbi:MAG: hypothetical protein GY838_10560 [bacterium]|nr:hypothetical protein [bacterium]